MPQAAPPRSSLEKHPTVHAYTKSMESSTQIMPSPVLGRTASPRPPPFLGLPKSIRRQIYEYLPICTKYVPGYRGEPNDTVYKDKPVVILVLRYIERTIVQTCRQLAAEAEPVLEIETMKLGPARLIVAAEYFHRIPYDMRYLRQTQDDATWPRLRISDQDRETKTLEDQQILMWARILQLNLLSEKSIRIGIFMGKQAQEVDKRECLSKISLQVNKIIDLQWWAKVCIHSRPILMVSVDWEGGDLQDIDCADLQPANAAESCAIDAAKSLELFGVCSLRKLFVVDEEPWKNVRE